MHNVSIKDLKHFEGKNVEIKGWVYNLRNVERYGLLF